jgi:alpha-N-acetylglucosaminidase
MRRAGNEDQAVIEAWEMMKQEILVDSAVTIWNHMNIYQVPPVADLNNSAWRSSTRYPYRNAQLARVLSQMFQADDLSVQSDVYKFDIVNLTRQVLGNYGRELYYNMMQNYEQGNRHGFRRVSDKFITLGLQIDSLLGTRHEFLLGKWLADARRWGSTETEHAYYERDAREIITTWHVAGGELTDYSNRQWNGLIRSYYLPRWIEFIKRLDQSMTGLKQFDSTDFTAWCTRFEQDWVNNPSYDFIEAESGDAVDYSYRLFLTYRYEIM